MPDPCGSSSRLDVSVIDARRLNRSINGHIKDAVINDEFESFSGHLKVA